MDKISRNISKIVEAYLRSISAIMLMSFECGIKSVMCSLNSSELSICRLSKSCDCISIFLMLISDLCIDSSSINSKLTISVDGEDSISSKLKSSRNLIIISDSNSNCFLTGIISSISINQRSGRNNNFIGVNAITNSKDNSGNRSCICRRLISSLITTRSYEVILRKVDNESLIYAISINHRKSELKSICIIGCIVYVALKSIGNLAISLIDISTKICNILNETRLSTTNSSFKSTDVSL